MVECSECYRSGVHKPAMYWVWPNSHPTGYDYLCAEHMANAITQGMQVNTIEGFTRVQVYLARLIPSGAKLPEPRIPTVKIPQP